MSNASVLPMTSQSRYVTIRQDFIELCNGDHCQAALVGVLERWTNWSIDKSYQISAHNAAAKKENKELEPENDYFFYLSGEQLELELLGLYSREKISKSMQLLITAGFVISRSNPKFKWDRTKQYALKIESILKTLHSIDGKQAMDDGKTGNGLLENRQAIQQNHTQDKEQNTIERSENLEIQKRTNSLSFDDEVDLDQKLVIRERPKPKLKPTSEIPDEPPDVEGNPGLSFVESGAARCAGAALSAGRQGQPPT